MFEDAYYDAVGNMIGIEMPKIDNDLFRIIGHYGVTAQKSKAIEELIELSEVLIKDVNKNKLNVDALYEEMADVEIMMKQLGIIYNIDKNRLQQEEDMKIQRTLERIRNIDPDCGWK